MILELITNIKILINIVYQPQGSGFDQLMKMTLCIFFNNRESRMTVVSDMFFYVGHFMKLYQYSIDFKIKFHQ